MGQGPCWMVQEYVDKGPVGFVHPSPCSRPWPAHTIAVLAPPPPWWRRKRSAAALIITTYCSGPRTVEKRVGWCRSTGDFFERAASHTKNITTQFLDGPVFEAHLELHKNTPTFFRSKVHDLHILQIVNLPGTSLNSIMQFYNCASSLVHWLSQHQQSRPHTASLLISATPLKVPLFIF